MAAGTRAVHRVVRWGAIATVIILVLVSAVRPSLALTTWRDAALIGDFLSGAVAAVSVPLVAVALILQATATRLQARALRLGVRDTSAARRQSREDQVISIVTSLVASRVSVATARMNVDHRNTANRGRLEELVVLEGTIADVIKSVVAEAERREAVDPATAAALKSMMAST